METYFIENGIDDTHTQLLTITTTSPPPAPTPLALVNQPQPQTQTETEVEGEGENPFTKWPRRWVSERGEICFTNTKSEIFDPDYGDGPELEMGAASTSLPLVHQPQPRPSVIKWALIPILLLSYILLLFILL